LFDAADQYSLCRIVDAAVSAFGEINAIVHNAGICQFVDFSAVTAEQIDRHMSVNFRGPFAITQAVVEQMKLQGKGGSVVSIASITATMGSSQLTHYASSKAAIGSIQSVQAPSRHQ